MIMSIDVTEYAKQYGFILPVKIEQQTWHYCIGRMLGSDKSLDSEFDHLDSLLRSCSEYIKDRHNGYRTDVQFEYKQSRQCQGEDNMILNSRLKFDKRKEPYLLIVSNEIH